MPYVDPFDVATPSDVADASQGDDRIRELKRAIDERLKTFFEDWPDGEPLNAAGGRILLGMLQGEDIGSYGGQALRVGALLYDQQGKKLYSRAEAALEPMELELVPGSVLVIGTEAQKPNPPATDFYWANDTDILYVNEDDVNWIPINAKKTRKIRLTGSDVVDNEADLTGEILTRAMAFGYTYSNDIQGATPRSVTGYLPMPLPIGSVIKRIRLCSMSREDPAGTFGRVALSLYDLNRITSNAATVVTLENQDGAGVYNVKETAELSVTVSDAPGDILSLVLNIELFTGQNGSDAEFSYAEIEYEEP